ncbi:MAG: RluA family pseudouridine synthase [Alphaproteobacteria bacterium]|nr:MAG: RluA family pseudouridine synthase [Alphaproteobacteria bacterium]
MPVRKLTVTEDETGVRLDRWLKRHVPELTQIWLLRLLREGQIRVDSRRVKSGERLQAGQIVRLPPFLSDESSSVADKARMSLPPRLAQDLRERILFQDDDLLALNKPAGLAVQGGTGQTTSLDRVMAALLGQPVHLVHRLDRETSGVLLIALNPFAADKLASAFRGREAHKAYWAITRGVPQPDSGLIDQFLFRKGKVMMIARGKDLEQAQSARTLYRVLDSTEKTALVSLWPQTGRTHQLRAHLRFMKAPVLGDLMYGRPDQKEKSMFLHARRLVLPHPRGGKLDIQAPLPDPFSLMLTQLGLTPPTDEPEPPFDPSCRMFPK